MNKTKWICMAGLLMLLPLMGTAWADEVYEELLKYNINSYFQLDTSLTDIEFRSLRFTAEPDEYDRFEIESMTRSEPRGLLTLKVSLFKDNQLVKDGQVSIRILHYKDVLVAADRIKRYQSFDEAVYIIERRDITSLSNMPATSPDELTGCRSKRNISKDQILTTAMIEKIPVIISGQDVEIVYRSAGFEVSARGLAIQSGYNGDKIKVKNLQSKKIITATIRDSETVLVASR
jgi:flagella basal body P-ring formation protein FlgA